MPSSISQSSIRTAITWCLAWGGNLTPKCPGKVKDWRNRLLGKQQPDDDIWQQTTRTVENLRALATAEDFPSFAILKDICSQHSLSRIGLVYGGVTKVKSYVFESADLQEIRGASALLDRINLSDLPNLFSAEAFNTATFSTETLEENSELAPTEHTPFIPQLIVYATGGKILAFCPPAYVEALSARIEQQYAQQTLTANACAVGRIVHPLEIYLGLLDDDLSKMLSPEELHSQISGKNSEILRSYFNLSASATLADVKTAIKARKNFGELVSALTADFNRRRSGNDWGNRPSRRYPPMFETHPFLQRDDSDRRIAAVKIPANRLPDGPKFSESTARKRRIGQVTKRQEDSDRWWNESEFSNYLNFDGYGSNAGFLSWVEKFENFVKKDLEKDHAEKSSLLDKYDSDRHLFNDEGTIHESCMKTREARSLHEIGATSDGYVGYIYADGNSMGDYIRTNIHTPEAYQRFSHDILEATEQSVYWAITQHIRSYEYEPDAKSSRQPDRTKKDKVWIHPFEIITIGGDDVLLIVPANKAVEVAKSIGDRFEKILAEKGCYAIEQPTPLEQQQQAHRYKKDEAIASKVCLSTSSGVLITAANTPIYYADKLVSQLLKSAKAYRQTIKKYGYYGGTVDVLVLKAVTMISSDIQAFRKEALTIAPSKERSEKISAQKTQEATDSLSRSYTLKLYGAPYTLHELGGLIATVQALKKSGFPKSQLYQLRDLLSRGKRTAILNYLYFCARLSKDNRKSIRAAFDDAWCKARTNNGYIAPWLTTRELEKKENATVYETIWRDIVELEPFIEEKSEDEVLDSDPRVSASHQRPENLQIEAPQQEDLI